MSPQISDLDADNAGEFFFLARIPPIVGDRQAEEPVAAMALTKGTTPGAAPTPPPEIPKPNMLSKPHVYLVFFNHLEYTLTPEAIKILRDVQDSLFYFLIDSINIPNILVVGYDDLSGSRQDSQLISERRAMSVANQLIRQGVPRELIYVAALGQEDPLILPSGEGVPQNRRVKIVIDPTPKDISDAGARLYAANCISRHRLFVQRIGEAHVSDSSTALRAFGRWR